MRNSVIVVKATYRVSIAVQTVLRIYRKQCKNVSQVRNYTPKEAATHYDAITASFPKRKQLLCRKEWK